MKTLLFLAILLTGQSLFAQSITGCSLRGSITSTDGFYQSSGNETIDKVTNEELRFLSTSFTVRPAFFFYDDNDGENAYSTSEQLNESRSDDGTVCFGLHLLKDQIALSVGGTNVPIILAHEFGHTVARKYGLHLPTKQNELFADYLAGGYMFYRSIGFKPTDINAAFRAFYNMGDNDFTNPDHHGTPLSRSTCLKRGYYDCLNAHNQGKVFSLDEGVQLGLNFVTSHDFE